MIHSKNLTRRKFLEASAAGLGALALKPRIPGGPEDGERPNILFILTDDQRFDTMGCAGNPIIRTPNVDALAREGVRFERAFVTTPICAASRASILTGTFERTHTYTFTKPPLTRAFTDISYSVLLRKAGIAPASSENSAWRWRKASRRRCSTSRSSRAFPTSRRSTASIGT